jgi:hypothetical protein
MPRYIAAPEIQLPSSVEPQIALPPGWMWVQQEPAAPERPFSNDSRAVARERWGATPIEGTFSIEGPNDFELTLVDELRDAVRERGMGNVRRDFLALERQIMDDPLGEASLDHFKDTDAGRTARVVHPVTGALADLIPGKRLALKGTGLAPLEAPGRVRRTDLSTQFRVTLEAQRRQQARFPDGIGGCVTINEVYGILRYRQPDGRLQEWMLMEQVDGNPVPNAGIALARLSSSGPSMTFGFRAEQEPGLAEILYQGPLGRHYARDTERFDELGKTIGEQLGYPSFENPFADLNGNNILRRDTEQGPQYTIIDVQSH